MTDQIILACEVPVDAVPGSTFHVQLNNRFFEVVTPDGAVPGQTINIVVPSADLSMNEVNNDSSQEKSAEPTWFENLRQKTSEKIRELDEQYKVSHNITEASKPAVEGLKSFDEKYEVTKKTVQAAEAAQAKIIEIDEKYEISLTAKQTAAALSQKLKELDEEHKISERASAAGAAIVTYAKEIDEKYAITAISAHLVEQSYQAAVAGIIVAQEHIAKLQQPNTQNDFVEADSNCLPTEATVESQPPIPVLNEKDEK